MSPCGHHDTNAGPCSCQNQYAIVKSTGAGPSIEAGIEEVLGELAEIRKSLHRLERGLKGLRDVKKSLT